MHPANEYINIFVTLLAIVDPMGAIPIFISLTANDSEQSQKSTAWISAATVALVLVGSALFGEILLKFFGISISSFRVAGGLLLLLIGINMLHARQNSYAGYRQGDKTPACERENIAVVPLAVPLLSGPGAISSMTIYAHRDLSWHHTAMLVGIGLAVALLTGWMLRLAQPIGRMLGKTGVSIAIRLMGLLLSAAGVQFITEGLLQLFPKLG
jgi:multiple antibiotic resistance protein